MRMLPGYVVELVCSDDVEHIVIKFSLLNRKNFHHEQYGGG